jgi:hypothetical protein
MPLMSALSLSPSFVIKIKTDTSRARANTHADVLVAKAMETFFKPH